MLEITKSLIRNKKGATAIEFAIIAPVLFLIIFSIIEIGIMYFSSIQMQLAVSEVIRQIESGKYSIRTNPSSTQATMISDIKSQITAGGGSVLNGNSVQVDSILVTDYKATPLSEVCYDPAGNRQTGATCAFPYQDTNGNGKWDSAPMILIPGKGGGPGDVFMITISYTWKIFTPLLSPFFTGGKVHYDNIALVKNEVF